jgi:hypothetical protein
LCVVVAVLVCLSGWLSLEFALSPLSRSAAPASMIGRRALAIAVVDL